MCARAHSSAVESSPSDDPNELVMEDKNKTHSVSLEELESSVRSAETERRRMRDVAVNDMRGTTYIYQKHQTSPSETTKDLAELTENPAAMNEDTHEHNDASAAPEELQQPTGATASSDINIKITKRDILMGK